MQELITETSDLVTMTPVAAAKVRELLEAEGNPELALRVYVAGGGCSGLQYGMALDDSVMEGDSLVEYDGIRVLVDSESLGFIEGSGQPVDFVATLLDDAGHTVSNRSRWERIGAVLQESGADAR